MSSGADYSAIDRLLHRVALGSGMVAEMSFDMEWAMSAKHCRLDGPGRHVFVAGMARAGTTLAMRLLYETGDFHSLTYRDMPFVLAPNLWSRISSASRRQAEAKERAHGDGMMVDFDSPEALEEVFWRVFAGSQYLEKGRLVPMQADAELITRFQRYIGLIGYRYGGDRYLSKNNNNVVRLTSIARAFPASTVVIPFRFPLQHAASLLGQHQRFCKQQSDDKFIRHYMNWLGHHEFGLDHRPFVFDANQQSSGYMPDQLEYWVERWVDCYGHLIQVTRNLGIESVFLCYEDLCSRPMDVTRNLMGLLELQNDTPTNHGIKPVSAKKLSCEDGYLEQRALDIYKELSDACRATLL